MMKKRIAVMILAAVMTTSACPISAAETESAAETGTDQETESTEETGMDREAESAAEADTDQGTESAAETDADREAESAEGTDADQTPETADGMKSSENESEVHFEDLIPSYEGTWRSCEAGVRLFLPEKWKNQRLTEEERESGLLYEALATDDSGWNLNVMKTTVKKGCTLEDVESECKSAPEIYANVELLRINGIETVTYDVVNGDCLVSGLAFLGLKERELLYTVTLAPTDDEAFREVAATIMASLSVDTENQ